MLSWVTANVGTDTLAVFNTTATISIPSGINMYIYMRNRVNPVWRIDPPPQHLEFDYVLEGLNETCQC